MMCATIGAGTVYRSSAPEFTPDFCGVGVVLSLTSVLDSVTTNQVMTTT
jgi:hypothetical protein